MDTIKKKKTQEGDLNMVISNIVRTFAHFLGDSIVSKVMNDSNNRFRYNNVTHVKNICFLFRQYQRRLLNTQVVSIEMNLSEHST